VFKIFDHLLVDFTNMDVLRRLRTDGKDPQRAQTLRRPCGHHLFDFGVGARFQVQISNPFSRNGAEGTEVEQPNMAFFPCEEQVNQICCMGFEKAAVERALQEARGNPEAAVDLLVARQQVEEAEQKEQKEQTETAKGEPKNTATSKNDQASLDELVRRIGDVKP
jgi:hypothetical protein